MILHVDMDAFYASVEERENPALKGHPLIVGGSPERRGVVAAANYAVRAFGVHSAMPSATARRLCPDAVFLPPRLDYYAAVSRQIQQIFHRYTPQVEPLSLDEAFLDVGASVSLFGSAIDIAVSIKRDIAAEIELVASVGVAGNKFLAKLASEREKPDGLVVVAPGEVQRFLDPLPVGALWGVGQVARARLEALGLSTVAELRECPIELLQARFGRQGEHLWALARGIDKRAVVPDRRARSLSHETTFARDVTDRASLRAWLLELSGHVARRLRENDCCARSVSLKIRYGDFHTTVHTRSLAQPSDLSEDIWQAVRRLFRSWWDRSRPGVRLLGVGVGRLVRGGPIQGSLFDEARGARQRRIDRVLDSAARRFGSGVLRRGAGPDT